jgi:membrane protease YdiL (CAAX protease family)
MAMGFLTLALVVSTYFLHPALFVGNIHSAIVIPIFEEFLFRGWGWNQMGNSAPTKGSGFIHWLVVSFLFGLWHFGYLDIYVLKVAPANPNMDWGFFLLMKFLTAFVIGLVAGLPRWRTGRVYGSLLLHSLINVFGR